ncbi:MAG: glutamine--fructose-6-phosphate transaminase (isomerizing) [Candidatus Eisenbacteria bacterium]|uniref:Glutamine--fructose-6-phosphate aminotransferase [isomerizing] n=1 Tax=Eiseniibacteriota bacterium TaxID=2212470 RepID=A0A956NBR2_UNCEI|nr:glutamine--fructose-6-phosphate transaminase (isomerizing) [Candidatus Eisenbacteria bacterium]MCB9462687.1 glutamine--fructose-6-phosphate transaminase (isomerizing) [Candidatus Eisenbacteria bacterium]
MCGIVGYTGPRESLDILIGGLERLEYRGYDSAGVAIVGEDGRLRVRKDQGKLQALKDLVAKDPVNGNFGIAHTRWATHGAPNQVNAHPHTDQTEHIAIVHNGIIENCDALREALRAKGHTFDTETDTEVLSHLIGEYWDGTLEKAVAAALRLVEGAFGVAVISDLDPGKIVGARKGSPLVVGVGDGEYFVASDVAAILQHTNQVIYLADDEMVVITRRGFRTQTIHEIPVSKEIEEITWELSQVEKGGYDHFMLKEIFEQPRCIQNAIRGRLDDDGWKAHIGGLNLTDEELLRHERVVFLACGTSWHAAMIGEYMIEEYCRIPVEVEYASEFRYRNPVIDSKTLVIVISQSGETADTLAAMREAQRRGATALGICNVVGSTIAREADGGMYIHAGPEIGVASTKAFTSQVATLAVFTLHLARLHGLSDEPARSLIHGLRRIPEQMEKILASEPKVADIARHYYHHDNCLYLGRGYNFPVALEGALKLKEISYVHAEGYPAAEMKHGPIALIDENMPVVFICTKDSAYDKIKSNMQEVRARQGRIIAVATEGDTQIQSLADEVLYVPPTVDALVPLLSVLPLQMLSYHVAVLRGCNVDQPRNLAKSVTVE